MGLFGGLRSFIPQLEAPSLVSQQQMPAEMSPSLNVPQIQQGRGLFGNRPRLQEILAGVSDGLDPLTSHPTGGGQLAALRARQKVDAKEQAQKDAFAAAFKNGKFDPNAYIAAMGAAGGDVGAGILTALAKPEDPLLANKADLIAAQTEAARASAQAHQDTELDRQEQQARIDAIIALGGQRQAQTGYLGVKTKQPYAPPRPRASGGGGGGFAGPARISSQAQFNALPSGSTFVAPDGSIRRKP